MSARKEGTVHKCPNCGANIGAFASECPECGHEIRNNKASDSVMNFADRYMNEEDPEQQAKLVEAFPVPNNREDLLEFMAMAGPQAVRYRRMSKTTKKLIYFGLVLIVGLSIAICSTALASDPTLGNMGAVFVVLLGVFGVEMSVKGGNKNATDDKRLAKAWESKMEQVRNKAKVLSVSDPSFSKKMNIISSEYNRKKKTHSILLATVWGIVLCLVAGLCFAVISHSSDNKDKETKITEMLQRGDYDAAANLKKELLPSGNKDESDAMYFEFLAQCVKAMCNEGKIDEARNFISARVLYFKENPDYGIGIDRSSAESKLNDIIDNQ